MSRINLLPWRAELRARQKKQFLASLGFSALMGVVASGLIFSYYSAHVSGQEERNQYLQQQIEKGQKRIEEIKDLDTKKQRLLARKEVIDALQADRSRVVRLFESLVKTTPDGVVLTLVKQNDQGLTIEGRAQSSTRVSTYMRNLEASGWMKNPELSIIEATKSGDGFEAFPFEFKMSVGLAKPEDMPAEALAAPVEAVPASVDPSVVQPGVVQPGAAGLAPATPDATLPASSSTAVPAPATVAPAAVKPLETTAPSPAAPAAPAATPAKPSPSSSTPTAPGAKP